MVVLVVSLPQTGMEGIAPGLGLEIPTLVADKVVNKELNVVMVVTCSIVPDALIGSLITLTSRNRSRLRRGSGYGRRCTPSERRQAAGRQQHHHRKNRDYEPYDGLPPSRPLYREPGNRER